MLHHGRQHLIICFDKTEKTRKTLSYAFLRTTTEEGQMMTKQHLRMRR